MGRKSTIQKHKEEVLKGTKKLFLDGKQDPATIKQKKILDIAAIKEAVEEKLRLHHFPSIEYTPKAAIEKDQFFRKGKEWIWTGIPGFDSLLKTGIRKGSSILVCGGPGSGKTIFCLQTLAYAAAKDEKCFYMSFEESEEKLIEHMYDFGWNAEKLIARGKLKIKRFNPYDITRQVQAMLEMAKGELLIDMKPMLFPPDFIPDRIVVDSLSAIAAAFVGKNDTYRIYVEQLFRIFENAGATSFLISETAELPQKLTASGVEEFLADGVIVIYNLKHGNVRESAIECLKLRGASFKKKIVSMQIVEGLGAEVYPEQEVFTDI